MQAHLADSIRQHFAYVACMLLLQPCAAALLPDSHPRDWLLAELQSDASAPGAGLLSVQEAVGAAGKA